MAKISYVSEMAPGDTVRVNTDWETELGEWSEVTLIKKVSTGLTYCLEEAPCEEEQLYYCSERWEVQGVKGRYNARIRFVCSEGFPPPTYNMPNPKYFTRPEDLMIDEFLCIPKTDIQVF